MTKSYILRLIAGMICIFILSGCNKKYETDIFYDISDNSENIIDVVTEIYSDKDMFDKINTEKYNMKELNKLYPVEFTRRFEYEDSLHMDVVTYITSYGYMIFHYDEDGNYIYGDDIISEKSLKGFYVLNTGYSVDDVQKFDGNGDFAFLYAGYTGTPKISFHYTTDGYIVMIHYDSDYNVEKIEYRLI